MRIVIDGRWLGRTGIGRYTEELLAELQELDHDNEYLVLLLPEWYEKWRPASPNFEAVRTTYEVYTWQEQLLLGRQIWALRPDLVHFTSFNLPVFYPGRFMTTVHDLTLVHFKNVRGSGLKKWLYEFKYGVMRLVLRWAVQRAETVVVPTEFVRHDVAKLFPAAADKLVVTHEAVSPGFAEPADISKFGLPKKYLLFVGNYYPYKNVGRLVEAFARTKARQDGVKLVLNGKMDYFLEQIRTRAEELGLSEALVFPGRTSDAELAALYGGATLYVFPSLSEGFGLPPLEAMAYGAPVLTSNASCMPEVCGEAAEYFDPLDVSDMARKIDVLLADPKRQAELRQLGRERVKEFSWRRTANQTLAVYRKLLS